MAEAGLPRSSFLVLLALADRPRHGLGIVERVEELSHRDVKMGPGTLSRHAAKAGLERPDSREPPTIPDPDDDEPAARGTTGSRRAARKR
jgi:hypothetical protein